jgi:glycosyltransferase involved in cell wall biosynthesis
LGYSAAQILPFEPTRAARKDAIMIRYSVIIPEHDRPDEVRRQLPALAAALDRFNDPYEIIIVDDGSDHSALRLLQKLLSEFSCCRLLRLDRHFGLSVALNAGIQAARGEIAIALESGEGYQPEQISQLVEGLQRADIMLGRRRQAGFAKAWHRISRLPRWLLLGLDGHDPDCLFWAARREVFADINLAPGTARYLPALVARRGFRACEMYVEHAGPRRALQDIRPNLGDLLATWWHCRRWRPSAAHEITAGRTSQPMLRVVGEQRAADSAHRASSVRRIDQPQSLSADPVHHSPVIRHA